MTSDSVRHDLRLDPELRGPLSAAMAAMSMPLTEAIIPRRRAAARQQVLSDTEVAAFGCAVVDLRQATEAPATPLLLARPTESSHTKRPVLVSIHGGGMVAGDHRGGDFAFDLKRALRLGWGAASVGYRLAPEHGGTIPVEDCYAGLCWVARHAGELGLDPDRIVVTGNSAGGGLAAGASLLARDRGFPSLMGVLLQSPMLDDACDSDSTREFWDLGLWDGRSNLAGWQALLGADRGTASVSPYAAPARAEVGGLPPTYIDVGSYEALREEATHFAERIWRVGGNAELHVWQGAFHCFDQWAPESAVALQANRTRDQWLERVLTEHPLREDRGP